MPGMRSMPPRATTLKIQGSPLQLGNAAIDSNEADCKAQSTKSAGVTRCRAAGACGSARQIVTRRSGSGNGSGRRNTAHTALNIVVVAATPSVSVTTISADRPGLRTRFRQA